MLHAAAQKFLRGGNFCDTIKPLSGRRGVYGLFCSAHKVIANAEYSDK